LVALIVLFGENTLLGVILGTAHALQPDFYK